MDKPKKPRKRYFPVNQQINTDPQIRRLKRELGITGFSMWLEILARTDKDSLWQGLESDIASVLAGTCESNTRGSRRCLQWVAEVGWIGWQRGSVVGNREGLISLKWADYHNGDSAQHAPPILLNLPSEHLKIKNQDPTPPKPSADVSPKEGAKRPLSPELEEVSLRIYRLDQTRFKRLFEWIGQKRKAWYSDKLLTQILTRFEPYALQVDSWWSYLNTLAVKEEANGNARASEAEGERFKREEREWLAKQN